MDRICQRGSLRTMRRHEASDGPRSMDGPGLHRGVATMPDMPVEQRPAETMFGEWRIHTPKSNGRWTWEVHYPISRYKLTGEKSFATKAWAGRDAYRVIRLIEAKSNV
jgi:hypothetical protein